MMADSSMIKVVQPFWSRQLHVPATPPSGPGWQMEEPWQAGHTFIALPKGYPFPTLSTLAGFQRFIFYTFNICQNVKVILANEFLE